MSANPSPRLVAAYVDAQDRAQLARTSGDRAGAAYATAEARRIFRRIRKVSHR